MRLHIVKSSWAFILILQFAAFAQNDDVMRDGPVNLAHLNYLSEIVTLDGEPVMLTHIYANAPRYKWTDASGEGIAALDDVARAGVVYLDFYDKTKDARALTKARAALNFTLRMQTPDGEFFNFVTDRQGTINRNGITSRNSLSWWAYRGLWLLARGVKSFSDVDAPYAARLRAAYLKTEKLITARLANVNRFKLANNLRVPAWLPDDAADATGILVVALAEYQHFTPNQNTEKLLTIYADALAAFQLGRAPRFPFAMHPHTTYAPARWHAWGAHQAQGLALAGRILNRREYIASAQSEVDNFFAWQLVTTRAHEMLPLPRAAGLQAYGVNCMTQAAMNLFHATGERRYAKLAGLFTAWLNGDNIARSLMYDATTGRGYDGIDVKNNRPQINFNSGAESTIEALMMLQAIGSNELAAKYFDYKVIDSKTWQIIEAESANVVRGQFICDEKSAPDGGEYSNSRACRVANGTTFEMSFETKTGDDFLLYISRAAAPQLANTSNAKSSHARRFKAVFAVRIDNQFVARLASTDNRAYQWLDLLTDKHVKLEAGKHRLRVTFQSDDNRRVMMIDGLMLQPVVSTKTYRNARGETLRLSYDMMRGALKFDEPRSL